MGTLILSHTNNDIWLGCRYLQVRIYLLRPIFVFVCTASRKTDLVEGRSADENDFSGNLAYRTALQCSLLCVETAIKLINVMFDNLTSSHSWGRKPVWLYGVLRKHRPPSTLSIPEGVPSFRGE